MGKSCELFLDHNIEIIEYWNNLQVLGMAAFRITILSLRICVCMYVKSVCCIQVKTRKLFKNFDISFQMPNKGNAGW